MYYVPYDKYLYEVCLNSIHIYIPVYGRPISIVDVYQQQNTLNPHSNCLYITKQNRHSEHVILRIQVPAASTFVFLLFCVPKYKFSHVIQTSCLLALSKT